MTNCVNMQFDSVYQLIFNFHHTIAFDFIIIKFEYQPLIEDFYNNGEMKIESILKIFENSGNRHSDSVGDYVLQSSSNGFAWVLTDWLINIDFYPKYGDKIHAITWSQGVTSLFGTSRDFELYCNDKLCAKGTTRWVYFDMNSGRPTKITDELLAKYEPEKKSVFEQTKLAKIQVPETFSTEIEIQPRRNDIDFNHHVHNLVYVDYAMDALSEEVYKNHNFKNIRITYKSAVVAGEKLKVKSTSENGKHTVCIYNQQDELKTLLEFGEE